MATWPQVVQTLGKWYQANIHTYWGSRSKPRAHNTPQCFNSPYGPVWDDCTGFCSTCLQVFGIFKKGKYNGTYSGIGGQRFGSSDFASRNSMCGRLLMKGGFACLPFSWAAVRPYDIISVYRPGGHHHAEIYYGKINGRDYSYGWGNVHDGINGHAGMPHPTTKYNDYQLIWRHNGTSIDTPIYSGDYDMQQQMNQQYGGGLYGQQQDSNAYPVHEEYVTITQQYGNIFENTADNAITVASLATDSSWFTPDSSSFNQRHVRIYSTNDSSIVLDELSLPVYHQNDNFANRGIEGERERDNMARIDRSLYETTDASTNQVPDSSINQTATA